MGLISKPISVAVARPANLAYECLSLPENFPRWATGWIAETPEGPVTVCFSERNSRGVLDYALRRPSGHSVYVPLRVVGKGTQCELVLTFFRPANMSDEEFTAAVERAKRDLLAAKGLVESQPA